MSRKNPKYQMYSGLSRDGSVYTTVAVTHFAGDTVRGVAKCNVDVDKIDQKFGEDLAIAKCNIKLMEKKCQRAETELGFAILLMEEAKALLENAQDYYTDATTQKAEAENVLAKLMERFAD